MITYFLQGEYHARVNVGHGLSRQVFYGASSTRELAMAIAWGKAEVALMVNNISHE